MNRRPILYSPNMVRSYFNGWKSVTRRIVKDQPVRDEVINGIRYLKPAGWPLMPENEFISKFCRFAVDDIIWGRENVWEHGEFVMRSLGETGDSENVWSSCGQYSYPATDEKPSKCRTRPSIHMPYDACRIFQRVTRVTVERVQDITVEQAIAEGIEPLLMSGMQKAQYGQLYRDYTKKPGLFNDGLPPIESFRSLWVSINGEESYNANPYVFAISFERTEKPAQ